jgi:hypothetical protein
MTWRLSGFVSQAGNFVQHIAPVDDLYEHVLTPDCWCKPTVDDSDFTVVHQSADQREKFERGERKPS